MFASTSIKNLHLQNAALIAILAKMFNISALFSPSQRNVLVQRKIMLLEFRY